MPQHRKPLSGISCLRTCGKSKRSPPFPAVSSPVRGPPLLPALLILCIAISDFLCSAITAQYFRIAQRTLQSYSCPDSRGTVSSRYFAQMWFGIREDRLSTTALGPSWQGLQSRNGPSSVCMGGATMQGPLAIVEQAWQQAWFLLSFVAGPRGARSACQSEPGSFYLSWGISRPISRLYFVRALFSGIALFCSLTVTTEFLVRADTGTWRSRGLLNTGIGKPTNVL